MSNKRIAWLGLLAILTTTPVLVAFPADEPTGSPKPAPVLLGPPQNTTAGPNAKPAEPQPTTRDLESPRKYEMPTREPRRREEPILENRVPVQIQPPEAFWLLGLPRNNSGQLILAAQPQPGEERKDPTPSPTPTPPAQSQALASLQSFYGLPSVAGTTSPTAAPAPAASTNVSGQSAVPSSGVGGLLANSNSAQGVEVQRRSPLVGDPRIEGLHFGQIVTQADGGYWFPARVDLDSVVSKLNSSDISNILIVRGPFSVRYGAGFSFMDIESLPTPRSTQGCFDAHGSSSLNYRTNSQGWQGQQSVWGGNTDWGFRLTYDIQSAGNYWSGNGTSLPTSFNNQFANFAFGIDISKHENLEFKYLHVQQTNVLFPGLLTDINGLTTDAFTARYSATNGHWYDKLTLDIWLNTTRFNGNSSNPQVRAQIPALDNIFPANLTPANAEFNAAFGPVRLDIQTDGNAVSYGLREITTWGEAKGFNVSVGADIRVFANDYNEYDAFNLSVLQGTGMPANLGIPYSRQVTPGLFVDGMIPLGEQLVIKAGGRVDFNRTDFLSFGPNVDIAAYKVAVGDPASRTFNLFSGFATGEFKATDHWTFQGGYGYAERPPTLTELYAGGAFLGLIQNGFNSIYGDPSLQKEIMHQISLGVSGKYDLLRVGANAFYAFMPNYITYDNLGPFVVSNIALSSDSYFTATTPINRLRFMNTALATIYGFDAYGEYDALPWLTPFATLSFVEGWDQTRGEALPGIAPLSTRVGFRLHEPGTSPRWGVECMARMVATQDLFAASLGEQRTGGFVVYNLRAYWQPRKDVLLLAGVENIGDLQYREHLDLRTGNGVFQPGVNFYFGTKISY